MTRGVVLALLALAACSGSGELGQDDIRAALTQAGNRGGPKAEKLACKSSPDRPGYACDYRAPACNRYTGTCGAAKPFSGRFVHAGGRWQLVEDTTPRTEPDPVTQPLPGISPAPTAEPSAFATATETASPVVVPLPPMPSAPETQVPPRRDRLDQPSLDPRDRETIARWEDADGYCREGTDERGVRDACRDQERLARRLSGRGLCQRPGAGWGRCD